MKRIKLITVHITLCAILFFSFNTAYAENMNADAVVIGAGASGLCSALTLAFRGANVIVFEKMPFPGGTSNFAEGLFAVESKMQIKEMVGLTREQAFKRHMENTHWLANARLVRAFIDKSADTINWLEDLGVEFIKPAAVFPDGPRTWCLLKGHGAAMIKVLADRAKAEKGIKLLFETPAKSLIMDNNRAAGVIAEDKKGNTIKTKAKTVIIAAGGYTNNREMVEKYFRAGKFTTPAIPLKQTGGPIKMAWDAGAAPDGMGIMMGVAAVPGEKIDSQLWAAGVQPYLWINQLGERFCDESIFYNFPFAANALSRQPNGVGYCVFDENTKNYMMEHGIQVGLGDYVPVLTKLTKIEAEIERGVKEGKAFVGNSLEELAEKMSVDFKTFRATIDEYNKCYEKNHDFIFAKDRKYLHVIKKPKLYAVKSSLHAFTTLGGIKINHRTEVLNKEHKVIPGLYAVGNCVGGMYSSSYELYTTGGALGFAVNSGRIAGENALKYLGK